MALGKTFPECLRKKTSMQQAVRLNITLNGVLVTATSIIIAPSFAAQEHSSLVNGFFSGLLISLVLRTPGAYFEWYLARRTRHKRIYITHLVTGLFTALVVLTTHYQTGADTAGSAVGIYLFSSSIGLGITALATFVISRIPSRDVKVTKSRNNYIRPSGPVDTPEEGQSGQNDRRVSIDVPIVAAPDTNEALPSKESDDRPQAGEKSAIGQANRAGLVLGIVTGIASLVQGYDTRDAYKTIIALTAGGIGVAVIYLPTFMRRR